MSLEAGAAPTVKVTVGGVYDGKIAGLYDLEETLGSGHFAVVKLARHVFTGAKVAVKVVDKKKLDAVSKAHLFQEVRCMKLVQHPHVVRLYEVIDTQSKLYLVLEYGDGGDLYDYIMRHDAGLSEELARKYFSQILHAITYCHQLHVVHRDLKPENVVFFEKLGIVKLTDFGFSNKFSPGQKLDTFCGSLAYSAPEILLGDSYDAPAVDIWSLGVILYMLVCGQPPFEKANDSETLTMIMDCKYTVPESVSESCRQLIASMLVREPKQRATLAEIAQHEWLRVSADEPPATSEQYLPLVSREQLSEDDHAFIIQKMTNGNIAPKEEILQALDKNKYNHITATYFLLAELRLRKRQEELEQRQKLLDESSRPTIDKPKPKALVPIRINISPAEQLANETKLEKRPRKCSIVCEEDEEESAGENSTMTNELDVGVVRRESISDNRLNISVQERTTQQTLPITQPSRPKVVVRVDATLAQKLNRIDKQHHASIDSTKDEEEENIRGLKELNILPAGAKNPVLTHRRPKLNKIRTPSCSSSEASDDDTKTRNKKKLNKFGNEAPMRWRMHRRDSHDDSSDSQDQLYPSTASHANTAAYVSNKNTNLDDKNDGNNKEQNKTEDGGKSHGQKSRKLDWHSNRRSLPSLAESGSRRRRIRESQSLDRITEAQEYDLRHRSCYAAENHIEQRNSLFNLSTISLAETMEEYDEELEEPITAEAVLPLSEHNVNTLNVTKVTSQFKQLNISNIRRFSYRKTPKDAYKLNSIEEIDMIMEEKTLSKAIQLTGNKCLVTMKKLRRLGRLFPVVNLS